MKELDEVECRALNAWWAIVVEGNPVGEIELNSTKQQQASNSQQIDNISIIDYQSDHTEEIVIVDETKLKEKPTKKLKLTKETSHSKFVI